MDSHHADWWAGFVSASDRFDAALVVEGFGDLIEPKISAPLLRREAKIACEWMVRHLNRPSNEELAVTAKAAAARLDATLTRIAERGDADSTIEAQALSQALLGDYAGAAAAAEPIVGRLPLEKLFVTALRLERFDIPLVLRLLEGGQEPTRAVQAGLLIGRYSWWPSWLLRIVTERALAGTLDEDTIHALDNCAYASLSPAQARVARRLLSGEETLIERSAERLEAQGEPEAAEQLRQGDLNAVALAARLIPI